MKFVISGGGTAGHIYPAIAVGKELESQGHEVKFAGTPAGLESKLVPQAGFEFKAFDVSGFNRRHPTTLLKSSVKALKATSSAKKWLKQTKPDAVIGFGGYVSIPVGRAAFELKIPLVIHEQNSACGMANKYLAPHASAIAVTYEVAASALKHTCPLVITGNPVREEILHADSERARKTLRIPQNAELLLVFGGSLGARHINTAICNLAPELMQNNNLYVIHVTGQKEYDTVRDALIEKGIKLTGPEFCEEDGWENPDNRYMLTGYFNHMGEAIAASDVIVSRAGATSLAEITAVGAVALLVPYPYATDDHQTKNAQALLDCGASYMCPDDQVEDQVFASLLKELLEDESKRDEMRKKTKELGRRNAASKVALLAQQAAAHKIDIGEIDAL